MIALVNKKARMIWALLAHGPTYQRGYGGADFARRGVVKALSKRWIAQSYAGKSHVITERLDRAGISPNG
jgi:hypothetical protein